jgi:hypothetical protein
MAHAATPVRILLADVDVFIGISFHCGVTLSG